MRPNRLLHATLAIALAGAAPAILAAGGPDAEQRQLAAKLDPLVDCLNEHGNWTIGSRDRYLSWVKSAEKGPTGKEMVVYGLYELRDPADCAKGIAAAAELPPDLPELEANAAAFAAALAHAKQVTDEAHDYYDLEDYKDDGMARGKAMHAGVMQAFAQFADANSRLHEQVVAAKNEIAAAELLRLRDDPSRRREYEARRVLFVARELVDLGAVREDELDQAAFAAKLTEFDASYREAVAGAKETGGGEPVDSMVLDKARDFLKTAKDFARRARGGFKYEDHEAIFLDNNPEMIEGHPAKLVAAYNDLVDWSNRRMR